MGAECISSMCEECQYVARVKYDLPCPECAKTKSGMCGPCRAKKGQLLADKAAEEEKLATEKSPEYVRGDCPVADMMEEMRHAQKLKEEPKSPSCLANWDSTLVVKRSNGMLVSLTRSTKDSHVYSNADPRRPLVLDFSPSRRRWELVDADSGGVICYSFPEDPNEEHDILAVKCPKD